MRDRLAEYLAAKSRHDEAARLMHRAERIFDKLAKRIGDVRAFEIAGVALADERSVRAAQDQRRAFDALKQLPFLDRLRAAGALACADLPRPANNA